MSSQFCSVTSCNRFGQMPGAALYLTKSNRLCDDCLNGLRANVARLPDLFRECEEMLAGRRRAPVARVTGRGAGGLSLNSAAVNARADILAVAASWAGLIADERELALRPPRRIADLSLFLLLHLDWLVCHPAVVDAVGEFAGVVAAAKSALDQDDAMRVDLGGCDVRGCGGILRVVLDGGSSGVSCDRGHSRKASEWLSVARRINRTGMAAGQGGWR